MDQERISQANRAAWDAKAYEAWIHAYGSAADAAKELAKDPAHKARRLLPHLGDVKGKRIGTPLGSNGRLAVALALLGADVTVFDISESNRRFALEMAQCANVRIDYVVGDFRDVPTKKYTEHCDALVMELGILHYFADLNVLIDVLYPIAKSDGLVVINEFHPLLKKAVTVREGKVELAGDYFAAEIEEADVAYQAILEQEPDLPKCLVRRWTLGEIVTAFARSSFEIQCLEELPSWDCDKLPGMFTLVLKK